jgi:hypothetical protein
MITTSPINYDELLFRCHSLSKIMTDPRGKTNKEKIAEAKVDIDKISGELAEAKTAGKLELKTNQKKAEKLIMLKEAVIELEKDKDDIGQMLSVGAKSHLIDLYVRIKYDRRKEIHSKYLEKGLQTEEDGITNISLFAKKFLTKNSVRFENDYLTGEPDVLDGDSGMRFTDVYDNKSSWDIYTFNRVKFKVDEINEDYWWQMQGYGWLTGATNLHLCYNLIDTPEAIIQREIKGLWYSLGCPDDGDSLYEEAKHELTKKMIYNDIPAEEKRHYISFAYDPSVEQRIIDRITLCREYMKQKFK